MARDIKILSVFACPYCEGHLNLQQLFDTKEFVEEYQKYLNFITESELGVKAKAESIPVTDGEEITVSELRAALIPPAKKRPIGRFRQRKDETARQFKKRMEELGR